MDYIENINSNNSLLKEIPKVILGKLNIGTSTKIGSDGKIEAIILYGQSYLEVNKAIQEIGGTLYDLGYGYGIINIEIKDLEKVVANPYIQYIELPKSLYLTDSNSNRVSCVQRAQNTFGLRGRGILVGFIDSGIDFTHPAFRNFDGSTRIKYIYDLSTGGTIYNEAQINTALNSNDPYSVVPVYDLTEHGTHVAGIACAGGKIEPTYYGVAPESSIIMVKSGRGLFSLSTEIMKGLKFLIDKSKELRMPLVVNISLSTNDGAHNGTSLLEQYINTIAKLEKITIVIAAGNEGDAAHHVGGKLKENIQIKFNVADDETAVLMNLYKSALPNITLELITPTGDSTGEIEIKEGLNQGVISENRYSVFNTGPKPFDINGEITIALISDEGYIISGEWTIIIRVVNEYVGMYDIWLPISEGLNQKTKFLEPTVDNTLGIPATVSNVISVGSYNYLNRNISSFSGRGKAVKYSINKPDLVAPGEGITSAAPNRSFDTKSGTSMAAPHVSGISALIMEWGIVKGNDPFLYGERLKYYLVTGAKKERKDIVYPDPSWGYGEVCAYNSMEELIKVLNRGDIMPEDFDLDNNKRIHENDEDNKSNTNIIGILVEYINKAKFLALNNLPNTSAVSLNDSYGIIYLPINEIENLDDSVIKTVIDDINPPIYTLTNISPVEASNAINYHINPYLNLSGKGVIIGIVDTGIDYLNTEFQKEDDTTRILKIWDQTIDSGQDIYGFKFGAEYTEEQINQAIKLKKSGGDPYSIVPSKDDSGHGTMIAGLAAARGKNPDLVGAAPQCNLVVVKLKEIDPYILKEAGVSTNNDGKYSNIDIFTGFRYISFVATQMEMPFVLLMCAGTNTGGHDGLGILDAFIDGISSKAGSIVVTGTGNEGDTDTHTQGIIENKGSEKVIELKVGANQKTLNFQIWIDKPDVVSIAVVSPSGETVGYLDPKLDGKNDIKFVYEGTTMDIIYQLSDEITGEEIIIIKARDLKEGIWQFKLRGDYIVSGKYWSWLPQRSLLDDDTKFLSPSQYMTLTIPSDGNKVLSVAYYNQNNNATVGSSGRGYTRDERKKPDIAAGGIGAKIIKPGGAIGVASGASVAASVAAGVCAMLLEWAITQGNQPEIYSEQIIAYIIKGARMRRGDKYPNQEWGYGSLDVTGIFDAIRGNYRAGLIGDEKNSDSNYEEYTVRGLFVRNPI